VVYSKLLEYTDPKDTETCEKVYGMLFKVIRKFPLSLNIKIIALSYIAPLLTRHPILCDVYINLLLDIPHDEREGLLHKPEPIIQLGLSCTYKIQSNPQVWNALGVAQALTRHIMERKLDNYDHEHFQIMQACINTANVQESEVRDAWNEVLMQNSNHLFAGLCNEEFCEEAAEVLIQFFRILREDALKV
jgi:hypothetical protein